MAIQAKMSNRYDSVHRVRSPVGNEHQLHESLIWGYMWHMTLKVFIVIKLILTIKQSCLWPGLSGKTLREGQEPSASRLASP